MFVPAARMSTGRLGRFEAMDWFHLTMRITVLTQGQAPKQRHKSHEEYAQAIAIRTAR
jgi:hypothetical protein